MGQRAKIGSWYIERTNGNIFRAQRPGRTVYFKLSGESIVQCDKAGFSSPSFIAPFTQDDRARIAQAAKSLPQ